MLVISGRRMVVNYGNNTHIHVAGAPNCLERVQVAECKRPVGRIPERTLDWNRCYSSERPTEEHATL